jgi:hypothetical protein
MFNVRAAIKAVRDYLDTIGDLMPTDGMRLEETAVDERSGHWLITVSFVDTDGGFMASRIAKIFEIEPSTGEVISMKSRKAI